MAAEAVRARTEYRNAVQRVLWITLVLNVLVALAKLIAGMAMNSLMLLGDAAHSGIDAANNVIGLVAVGVAVRAADDDHPYGHSKIETLAAFVLAGLLFITCFQIAIEAFQRLLGLEHSAARIEPVAFVVVAGTLVVNVFVSQYEARWAKRLRSDFLLADAAHTRSDVLVTATVLISLALVKLGWKHVDAGLSLVIALLIGRIGFKVFQRTVPVLVDASAVDERQVRSVLADLPNVLDPHAIRSRRSGEVAFIDLHIVIDPGMDTAAAHAVTENVEEALERAFGPTNVTVHVETSRHCGM
jgi:cation diffusion facilitator family transporter